MKEHELKKMLELQRSVFNENLEIERLNGQIYRKENAFNAAIKQLAKVKEQLERSEKETKMWFERFKKADEELTKLKGSSNVSIII